MFKQSKKSKAQKAGEVIGSTLGAVAKPRKKSHKKEIIGFGIASAVIAAVAGAFAKDKDRPQ